MSRAMWHGGRTTMAEIKPESSAEALDTVEASATHHSADGLSHRLDAGGPSTTLTRANGRGPRWYGFTAFVLSGGGARGALQVGALRALMEAGIRPDVVVGTSIGAWNGALLAREPTLTGVDTIAAAWLSAHPTRVLLGMEPPANSPVSAHATMRMLVAARRIAAGHSSLYGDTGLRDFIKRLVGDLTFEDLALPLRVIATDITHGTRAVFGSGPLGPAILASSAIPGIFPPVRIEDAVYVDGGALDNSSIETALALGARRLFVLDVGYDEQAVGSDLWSGEALARRSKDHKDSKQHRNDKNGGRRPSIHPLAALLERTSQVVSHYQLVQALARVPPGIETHVIHVGLAASGGALEFEKAPLWIDKGYEFTCAYLERARPAVPLLVAGLT